MLVPIVCPAQQYAWGKIGSSSTVAQLAKASGAEVDESSPYAELWVGTHANGPATVGPHLLSEWLKLRPECVSSSSTESNGELPYLFKILSVQTALSIQSHPDKKLAERLHAERPMVYKDPNHKPEMACAITEFEALCGFLPLADIIKYIDEVPELKLLINESDPCAIAAASRDDMNEFETRIALKGLFSALMKSSDVSVQSQVAALSLRLKSATRIPDTLALRLADQYPGDVGVFCAYMMSYRKLQPGQAVFLGANEPHAYLSGDCAEIMACSDNVIRAGLTPKLRDVDTLCSSLTYVQPGQEGSDFYPGNLMDGVQVDSHSRLYSPPDPNVTEFQMERIVLKKGDSYTLQISTYVSVLLVLEGSGEFQTPGEDIQTPMKRGDTFLQPADSVVQCVANDNMILFRATLKGATNNKRVQN